MELKAAMTANVGSVVNSSECSNRNFRWSGCCVETPTAQTECCSKPSQPHGQHAQHAQHTHTHTHMTQTTHTLMHTHTHTTQTTHTHTYAHTHTHTLMRAHTHTHTHTHIHHTHYSRTLRRSLFSETWSLTPSHQCKPYPGDGTFFSLKPGL